jgi:hypothetical protein
MSSRIVAVVASHILLFTLYAALAIPSPLSLGQSICTIESFSTSSLFSRSLQGSAWRCSSATQLVDRSTTGECSTLLAAMNRVVAGRMSSSSGFPFLSSCRSNSASSWRFSASAAALMVIRAETQQACQSSSTSGMPEAMSNANRGSQLLKRRKRWSLTTASRRPGRRVGRRSDSGATSRHAKPASSSRTSVILMANVR